MTQLRQAMFVIIVGIGVVVAIVNLAMAVWAIHKIAPYIL